MHSKDGGAGSEPSPPPTPASSGLSPQPPAYPHLLKLPQLGFCKTQQNVTPSMCAAFGTSARSLLPAVALGQMALHPRLGLHVPAPDQRLGQCQGAPMTQASDRAMRSSSDQNSTEETDRLSAAGASGELGTGDSCSWSSARASASMGRSERLFPAWAQNSPLGLGGQSRGARPPPLGARGCWWPRPRRARPRG